MMFPLLSYTISPSESESESSSSEDDDELSVSEDPRLTESLPSSSSPELFGLLLATPPNTAAPARADGCAPEVSGRGRRGAPAVPPTVGSVAGGFGGGDEASNAVGAATPAPAPEPSFVRFNAPAPSPSPSSSLYTASAVGCRSSAQCRWKYFLVLASWVLSSLSSIVLPHAFSPQRKTQHSTITRRILSISIGREETEMKHKKASEYSHPTPNCL